MAAATPSYDYQNNPEWQRNHWRGVLAAEAAQAMASNDWSRLGTGWGVTSRDNDPLGKYAHVRGTVVHNSGPESTVLEIGSYGGKWTQYMLRAAKVHAVDIFPEYRDAMTARFGYRDNVEYHVVPGDGTLPASIAPRSVDFVFSMDSLVRAPVDAITAYIRNSFQLLSLDGLAFLHIPWVESRGSRMRGFSPYTRDDLVRALRGLLCDLDMRMDVVVHGTIVRLRRSKVVTS